MVLQGKRNALNCQVTLFINMQLVWVTTRSDRILPEDTHAILGTITGSRTRDTKSIIVIISANCKGGSRHQEHHYEERVIFFLMHFSNCSTLNRNALAA